MDRSRYSLGIVVLFVGLFILFGKLGVFNFIGTYLWPLFILIPGILFHFLYFARILPAGILIPGGILTINGLIFLYCNIFGWDAMSYMWPFIILSVACGLYEFYFFDDSHPKGVLTASLILAAIGVLFIIFAILFRVGIYFIAIGLIIIGAYLIFQKPKRSGNYW